MNSCSTLEKSLSSHQEALLVRYFCSETKLFEHNRFYIYLEIRLAMAAD